MKKPVIAIVGRPNVGKSTFFNRLIRKRDAIVDDVSGVTRDRHYGEVEWNGRIFQLIDTGGYLPQAENKMDMAIREQVEIAIEEADALVFMVDIRTGITSIDHQIAEKLKKTEKPVFLVANKSDNQKISFDAFEFISLGLGEVYPISSIQGLGIGDFLDDLVQKVNPPKYMEKQDEYIKIAIVGRENVGKSSFVNTILGTERVVVTDVPGTTRDSIDTYFNYNKRKYMLIDTAGLKRRAKIKENLLFYSQLRTMRSIDRADVVLYMVDVFEGLVRQDMRVIHDVLDSGKGLVIAFNKWDLIEKDDKTYFKLKKLAEERLRQLTFVPMEFVSVLERKRLLKLLDLITTVYEEKKKRIKTSELNQFFHPVIEGTPPPAVRGKEIKINYITQVRTDPPIFAFFSNHPNLIPEHYKRFLENQLREEFGFKGVPVKIVFKEKN
jgi:GTP-binding protein